VSTFEPHWEALPAEQRAIWPELGASIKLGFVLYGGTAVALRLAHRRSVDFDFFTEHELDRESLQSGFRFLRASKVIQDRPDSLSVLAPSSNQAVKISFFGGITIGRAGMPERTTDGVVQVASLLDLLATKLKVMQQRIEVKDYCDIAAILSAGIALEDGLAAATGMYGSSFQPTEATKALSYFEGGDLTELSSDERRILVQAVTRLRNIPILPLVSKSLSS
jgi:hypothetical protein